MPTFDFARPFQFAFEDPNWMKKVLLLGLFFLIPLVGPFVVMGYYQRVIREVADGNDSTLPELDKFGEDLVNGLKMVVIALGYMAPGLLFAIGGFIASIVAAAAMDNDTGASIGGLMMMGGMCLGLPLSIIGGILSGIAVLRFVDQGTLGAAFQFGEVIAIAKANLVNILLAFVVGMIAGFIAQFGIIACFIGFYFTLAWSMMVRGHAWGQILKIDRARQGSPSPITTPSTPRVAGAF